MPKTLDVYFLEKLAGWLVQEDHGRLTFSYTQDYIQQPNAHPLSPSLPLQEGLFDDVPVRSFFSGLLPEGTARDKIAQLLNVSDQNIFGILSVIGRECAGALSIVPHGEQLLGEMALGTPPKILSDGDLEDFIRHLQNQPLLAGDSRGRISLAGAQNKMAVQVIDNEIALVQGAQPTTHIIKPPIERAAASVANEYFCMQLAKCCKFPVAESYLGRSGSMSYFLTKRYDREENNKGQMIRLHQMDFCQALGLPPEMKYEGEGGPSIKKCLELIAQVSSRPALDKITFLQIIIFNYMIGNGDAHAKNFSFLYQKDGTVRLAPAYDLLCTAIYSDREKSFSMAMKIGGENKPDNIFLRHWYDLVPATKLARRELEDDLAFMATEIPVNAKMLFSKIALLPEEKETLETINDIIQQRASHILRDIERMAGSSSG